MFYGSDLATAHDAQFGFLARAAAPALVRMLRTAGFRDGLVVDLACGSGIGAELLVEAGYDVLGVDVSADQLAIARRRVPAARLEQGSLFDFEPPPCVAVSIVGEGLCYTADPRAGRDAAREVFGRARAALAPGGVLLFDVVESGRERPEPRRLWNEGDAGMVCVEAWAEQEERLVRRRIVTFTPAGDGAWRRSEELHSLRELEREEVLADLDAAGFDARSLRGYGAGYRFRRGHAGFAAIRRP